MVLKSPEVPAIPAAERTPLVVALLAVIARQQEQLAQQQEQLAQQQEQLQALKDEIARLKGHKGKPKVPPSRLEQNPKGKGHGNRGRNKRAKTAKLEIHDTQVVRPADVPEGSRFKGYSEYTVVGIRFEPYNVRYRVQVWRTPDGQRLSGELPGVVEAAGGHFSYELVAFIHYQHHQALVPQNLICEQLQDIGVAISEGSVNRILVECKEQFHREKEEILRVGLRVSSQIHADDTGARHNGRNGVCTHIGNEWFAYFESTESKSRINFLSLLRVGRTDYVLDAEALAYMAAQKMPKYVLEVLEAYGQATAEDDDAWQRLLMSLGITGKRHVQIATEGALFASVLSGDINPALAVISDDAGQFDVLRHGLCWIHAERTLHKLVGFTDEHRAALEAKRLQVWDFYRCLKHYKEAPTESLKSELDARFEDIFLEKTCFVSLNLALQRLDANRSELLLVLDRPEVDLHNNLSENDIREYVTRRKRNGSTRSDEGRRCRDTFASLKKTCRKLGISFWQYLCDRFSGSYTVPQLAEIIAQRAMEAQQPCT